MESKIKCSVCGKEFSANEVSKNKKGNYICKKCRKKRVILWCAIIVALIAAAIGVYCYVSNRPIEGNGLSVLIETPDIEIQELPEFKLSEATPIAPSSVGQTIDNLKSFKELMAQNIAAAQESNAKSIEIPCISALFAFNSAKMDAIGKDLILEFISAYKQTNQQAKITINGYACNIGTNEANNSVSQARAKAVGDFIVSNGIPEENIEITWFGKSMNSMFDYPEMKDYRRVIIGIK